MAGKTNVSDYRFSIFINNDQAKRSLLEMEKTMMGYEADLKRLEIEGKKNSAEYVSRKEAITQLNASMVNMRKEAGLQALSLKELKSLQMQLRNELARAIPGSEHRMKLEKEFNAVTKRLNEVQVGAKNTGMSFSKMADGFNKYFAIVTAGIAAFSGIAFSIKEMITAQGELDDSLADIRKSTGMTALEVQNLNKELGKIDTRTSRQDLRQMAVVAGQLGMAKGDVFAFVESVDKLNVALGDEFTGGAEEVAKQMGMLRNVLTDSKTANVADDMMRVGNAINTLGAAGFATGPVMTDFASRIGGIGIPLGLTSDQVLGMSATLQELNVNAERGGTAVVKIMQKMTTNTKAFAGVAGMPIKEFTNLVNTDLYGAFLKVIEGSKNGGTSATALAGIIKELEISGVGASEIFSKLSSNMSMLDEKVTLAGRSMLGTKSITNEFNIKNATLGAVLAKLQKDFYGLITMPGVTEFFKNQVYHVVQLVNWFKELPVTIEKYKVSLIIVTGLIGVWIAAVTKSIQVSLINNLTLKEGILLKMKDAIALSFLIAKEEMLTIWKVKGSVASKIAATAQYLWNAAMAANPIGILIVGITALVASIKAYDKYNAESIRNEKIKASTIDRMNSVNGLLGQSYEHINDQIRRLNTLSQQEKIDLDDKIEKNIKLAETELVLMKARQNKVKEDNSKPTLWQRGVNMIANVGFAGAGAANNAIDAYNNGKDAAAELDDEMNKMQDSLDKLKKTKIQLNEITKAESIADGITGKTYEQLSEKLSKYQIALRNTTALDKTECVSTRKLERQIRNCRNLTIHPREVPLLKRPKRNLSC
jgi:TP901 family phage tail tape measure protein